MDGSDTSIDANVSSVDGAEDAVLEARWVLKIQVDLAVLAVLSDGDVWTDGGDVFVENQGEAEDRSDIYLHWNKVAYV